MFRYNYTGARRVYIFGTSLHEVHIASGNGFMTDSKYTEQIHVRSKYIPRTQHSAISLLNGLYANTITDLEIPLKVYPAQLETMLSPLSYPSFTSLVKELHTSNEWIEFIKTTQKDRDSFDRVSGESGSTYINQDEISSTFDQIIARQCTNQPSLCIRDANGVVGDFYRI
jgi:hypothetical protein